MDLLAELAVITPIPLCWIACVAYSNKRINSQPSLPHVTTRSRARRFIKTANLKIDALTFELAHHRRLRFATKSEAFSAEQRTLFEETWNTDLAAMTAEANNKRQSCHPPNQASACRSPATTGSSTTRRALSRTRILSVRTVRNALVKIGEDVSEQLDVEPARFLRSPPYPSPVRFRPCKPLQRHRFRPRSLMAAWLPSDC